MASGRFIIVGSGAVPGWTAQPNEFEVWGLGKDGVGTPEGLNFLELNVNGPTTIHQDFATTPRTVLTWSFFHRGRQGRDTLEVLMGPPSGPLTSVITVTTDTRWKQYSGLYTVPRGQETTRIAFRATGSGGSGNFLDMVTVEVDS